MLKAVEAPQIAADTCASPRNRALLKLSEVMTAHTQM